MKKLMTMIMACGAMFAAMPLMAETQVVDGITWTYTVNDDRQAIIGAGQERAIPQSTAGDITIPTKLGGCPVVGIGDSAFWGCSKITSITIPDGVTNVDARAFAHCSELKSILVKTGNSSFKSVSGFLLTKDGKTLVAGVNGKVKIPDGVTSIGPHAFIQRANLTSVTIPSGVTNIGIYAFYYCSRLTSVTIPDGVTNIEDFAFTYCSALTSMTIPDGVTRIRKSTFLHCYSLTSVTIPASVTSIGVEAFTDCRSLSDVYCYADPATLVWDDASNDFKSDKSTKVHVSAAHLSTYKSKFGATVNATFVGDLDIFTVKFNANGGTASETSRKVKKGNALRSLPDATKKGYKLKGWYTKKSGGSQILTTTKVTKNVTYYAHWTANKYTIKFNKNGGTGTMKKRSATYGKTVTLRANAFKKSGYKFAGWAKTKNGKVAYKNKAKVKNLTTVNGRTVTLYAVWKRKSSSVKYAAKAAATAKSAKVASAVTAAVPAWAVGTFYGGDGESLTAITVSASGKVSGRVFFAGATWTIEGAADGLRIDAVIVDADGGSRAIGFVVAELGDGRCRIESDDGTIWAEQQLQ